MTHYARYIKEIGRGAKGARALAGDEAEALWADILDDEVPELELGAILIALRVKGESEAEINGFARALATRTPRLMVPGGPHTVVIPSYNGARKQPNLMPWLALALARREIPVLIHGHFDFETRSDPFALLAALGIEPAANLAQAERSLVDRHIACVRLQTWVPGLHRLLGLRARLGVRNCGHSLAKALDPCPGRSLRLIPVTHPEYFERMDALVREEQGTALVFRGAEGEAGVNPRRRPLLRSYRDGVLTELTEQGDSVPLPDDYPDTADIAINAGLVDALIAGRRPVPQPMQELFERVVTLAGA